jgi:hypothetical protein
MINDSLMGRVCIEFVRGESNSGEVFEFELFLLVLFWCCAFLALFFGFVAFCAFCWPCIFCFF